MTRVRAALAYTRVILRQLARDRAALFFLVVLPIGIITIIGTVFGGGERLRLAVAATSDDAVAAAVVRTLDQADGIEVVRYDDLESVRAAVRRGVVAQGVVLEGGFGESVGGGGQGRVVYVVDQTDPDWFSVRSTVEGLVQQTGVRATAALVAASLVDSSFDEQLRAVQAAAGDASTDVVVTDVGKGRVSDLSRFSLIAPQQLVLFVFVNALGVGTALVVARRTGVLRRAFATRTSLRVLLTGVMLAWLSVALLESLLIVTAGRVLFGVEWGDPLAAGALVLVFAGASAGAGLLLGTLGRNEDRVSAIGPASGMVLGALGGCMVPLEVFPPAMLAVAHLTPHYWAVTGWQALVFDGEGMTGIAPQLGVLTVFAVVLAGAAAVGLRRELTLR